MQTVEMRPGEVRSPMMDFSKVLDRGETITGVTSVTITPGTKVTATGSPTFSGVYAQQKFTVASDAAAIEHKVKFTVTTSKGNTLVGDGALIVRI
jgi:hypothetical protein